MNYFPFHIGDYLSATRHLSWEEDMAYRRLLDTYYTTEKALPIDVRACCRLVMAQTKAQREAVRVVLEEYFVQAADGWHNSRADEELTAMFAKHEQQVTKDEHEAERMRRYRERRAEMFAALRERNIVPAWDVPIKELQRLFDANCTEHATPPATDLQREQNEYGGVTCNGDATAIPIPIPTPTPILKSTTLSGKAPDPSPKRPSPKPDALAVLAFLNEKTGRSYQPVEANIDFITARLKDGATVDELKDVIERKCAQWLGDEKMAEYLRPATLFNRTKFAQYQGETGTARAERRAVV